MRQDWLFRCLHTPNRSKLNSIFLPLAGRVVIWDKSSMDATMNNDTAFPYSSFKTTVEALLKKGVDRGVLIGGLVLWMIGWMVWKSYSLRVSMSPFASDSFV